MEFKRRIEKNRILDEIYQAETFIRVNEDSIEKFRNSQTDAVYNKAQVTKLKKKNEDRFIILTNLKDRLEDLESHNLDDELNDNIKSSTMEVNKKDEEFRKKKRLAKMHDEEKSAESRERRKKDYKIDKNHRYMQRKGMDGALRHYNKACDTVPSWLKSKLKRMPNNKGCMWKGVRFYGDKPPERHTDNHCIIENVRGGIIITTECTPTHINIYHQQDRGRGRGRNKSRPSLQSSYKRKIKHLSMMRSL